MNDINWDDPNLLIGGENTSPPALPQKQIPEPQTPEEFSFFWNLAFNSDTPCWDVDCRPLWAQITDDEGLIQLIQTFREIPPENLLDKCRNPAQKERWWEFKRFALELHMYLIFECLSTWEGEVAIEKVFPIEKPILKLYGALSDYYQALYNVLKYGFGYVQVQAKSIEQELKNKLRKASKKERPEIVQKLAILQRVRAVQTAEDLLHSVVADDFEAGFSLAFRNVYQSRPGAWRELRKLERGKKRVSRGGEVQRQQKYQKQLNKLSEPFQQYQLLRDFCAAACKHLAEQNADVRMGLKFRHYSDCGAVLDSIVGTLQHSRYSQNSTMIFGEMLSSP